MKNENKLELEYPEYHTFLPYQVTYSDRRSVSIQINTDASIIVRAPKGISSHQLQILLQSKKAWIYAQHAKIKEQLASCPPKQELTPLKQNQYRHLEKRYRQAASRYIPERVAFFQPQTGGHYERITIRDQKTRWGSCSNNGTLSFNYRLMLAPMKILDYVVVHELCHLTHMNHSKDFWNLVEHILPDYKISKKWLKENGNKLTIENLL